MSYLLAIDPGKVSGYALYRQKHLIACGICDPDSLAGKCPDYRIASRAVIEYPVVYPRSPVPPNDLIKLAIQVGRYQDRCLSHGMQVTLVRPSEWKGQLSKTVHHERLYGQLDAAERAVVGEAGKGMAPSLRHNMLDAVALGYYGCER